MVNESRTTKITWLLMTGCLVLLFGLAFALRRSTEYGIVFALLQTPLFIIAQPWKRGETFGLKLGRVCVCAIICVSGLMLIRLINRF